MIFTQRCVESEPSEVVDGFTPDLFAGPGAESIVQCLCSVDQVGGRMPAVLPQTCQIEPHWFGNITRNFSETFLLMKKAEEIQVLKAWIEHVWLEVRNLTSECIEEVLANIPAHGLKVGEPKQICCAQPLFYLICPEEKRFVKHVLSYVPECMSNSLEWDRCEGTHRSCMSMLRLWRKFPPKAKQSTGVRTAWIHPKKHMQKICKSNWLTAPVMQTHIGGKKTASASLKNLNRNAVCITW